GVSFSISATSINEVLGLPNPSKVNLKAMDMKGNKKWPMDTLVVEECNAPEALRSNPGVKMEKIGFSAPGHR
ncbi:hypothetical protein HAX54_003819, partial [Datura stramonium]|nr:hypothetical protein [Datura stramonium]